MTRSWIFCIVLTLAAACAEEASLIPTPPSDADATVHTDATRLDVTNSDVTDSDVTGPDSAGPDSTGSDADVGTPAVTECNDGIDNDGDGLVDWAYDVGCWGAADGTESSGTRAQEAGWTTFDPSPDSRFVYVSASEGSDDADGLTPETAVATPTRGAELIRDGFPDFLLFKRGDTWRDMDLGPNRVVRRFVSGRDAAHPVVISSYGDSTERPQLEIQRDLVDNDGHERRFLAIVGLAFVSFPKVPGDPAFNGADGGGLRFVATGGDVLVEDNLFLYGELVVQNVTNVEVRRNVFHRSYHVGTCAYNADGSRNPNGDNTYRPSGIFAGKVTGLLIEGNVFDENGWNPDVAEACATIYNHNMYLSGCSDLNVRDNLVMRASSIGVKMASGETGGSVGVTIEGNLFAEGEIGISMGGNGDTDYRFVDAVVANNVFTDIGRAQPTGRTLAWSIELSDNDGTEVSGNLFVNQPDLGNTYGIRVGGDSARAISIHDNLMYGMTRRALIAAAVGSWDSVSFNDNTLVTDASDECLLMHTGPFSAVAYGGNAYRSAADPGTWFCVDGDRMGIQSWVAAAGDAGAQEATATAPDVGRNLDSYAVELGLGTTLADFAAAARGQSRHTYRPELSAASAIEYIRAGYGFAPE